MLLACVESDTVVETACMLTCRVSINSAYVTIDILYMLYIMTAAYKISIHYCECLLLLAS